jgi:hypothetical protein
MNSSDGQAATNRKRKPLGEGGRTPKKVDWTKYRPTCTADGCANYVVNGGVCIRHGAKPKRKRCISKRFTGLVKGGVCSKHGAEVKRCSVEGCPNQAQKGGLCTRHGAKKKLCSNEGCPNQAVKGGVCWRHGAKNSKTKTN